MNPQIVFLVESLLNESFLIIMKFNVYDVFTVLLHNTRMICAHVFQQRQMSRNHFSESGVQYIELYKSYDVDVERVTKEK